MPIQIIPALYNWDGHSRVTVFLLAVDYCSEAFNGTVTESPLFFPFRRLKKTASTALYCTCTAAWDYGNRIERVLLQYSSIRYQQREPNQLTFPPFARPMHIHMVNPKDQNICLRRNTSMSIVHTKALFGTACVKRIVVTTHVLYTCVEITKNHCLNTWVCQTGWVSQHTHLLTNQFI
ncbi:hypothetical protein L873DRAFT_682987 [Choiromyces venosus 120613-1]|uniref:Uncharacterized protein n=1 Tax=Choiromyces venosus 120613-1 TaxID=1336337 RepID=A0A3N4IYJ1_9PEZI|nr:hypothetical protein L873DRAFT_682987 [Choiromyces venosus 120613-1]